MKFALMSDIHYISREMILDKNDKNLMLMPTMCESAFRAVRENREIDTVLITGDLTNDGDLVSTKEVVKLLRELKAAGKRVYVLTATHDFHHNRAFVEKKGNPVQYKERPWNESFFDPDTADYKALAVNAEGRTAEELIPPIERAATYTDLWNAYREFGVEDAISVCESGYSYCVDLDEDTRCLMLNDCFRDEESRHNVSTGFSPETYRWINERIKEAKKEGKFIFACAHHPFVPPTPAYKIGAGYRDMRESYPGHTLADMGLKLMFSGHSHFCDVGFVTSQKGNIMYDVTTPSVCHYPPQYRIVTLNGKEGTVKLETLTTPLPEGTDIEQGDFKQYLADEFVKEWKQKVAKMPAPVNTVLPKLQVKNLYPLCKKASKLTKGEYESIKEKYIFDIVMALVLNMQAGDGAFTPDTPLYKFMMGLSAVLDDVIVTLPFADVRKKYLKGYTISQIIEPMLFNNAVPDADAEFDFTQKPADAFATPVFKSNMGLVLGVLLYVLFVPASLLLPPATLISLPILTAKKRKEHQKTTVTEPY